MRLLMPLCLLLTLSVTSLAQEITLKPDASLDTILDALNARGQQLSDFSADVVLNSTDDRTGENSAQSGKVIFQKKQGGDSRIRVSFDTKKTESDGKTVTQKKRMDYVLDQGWLTDRDYQKKLEVRRQVLRPGQKMNLLKLGEGPFPLPIGQDKDEVKKQFEAAKVDPTADDPKGTLHVRLTPKTGTQFEKRFKQIDVFVDGQSTMPVRIDTTEKAGSTRSTTLSNLKLNAGATDADFALPDIEKEGWNRREEPFN